MRDLSSYEATLAAGGAQRRQPEGAEREGQRQPLDQWNEQEVIERMDKWFRRVTDERRHVERWSLLGTAFLLDQQYVDFVGSDKGSRLTELPGKRGRVRTIEQIIEPAYRSEMARLNRNRPQGTTVPNGLDPEDFESAQAADDLLSHIWLTYEVEEFQEQFISWLIVSGTALIGVSWDPMTPDPDGMQGSLRFRTMSPFEFGVPHLREQRLDRQPYVMITKSYTLDEVEDRWGQRPTPDHAGTYGSLDHRLSSVLSGGTRSGEDDEETVVVKETWIKPSPLAPQGAVVITGGNRILEMTTFPQWTKGRYPFAVGRYTPVSGSFWGKSMLQSLIPIQRRHNRAASSVVELTNLASQIATAVPRGTQVRSLLGGRGLMLESPPGATQPVTNITPPPVGDLPFRELELTKMAARDIASQHEVTKGYTPPNVRSGTAISMLKEMDDSPAAMPLRYIERAVQSLGRNVLEIVKAHWDEPRMVTVIGKEGEIERRSFVSGGEVGGQYHVLEGSAWPYTKAERQAEVLQLWDRQLIDADEALKRLDSGAVRGIREDREVDYREARLENQKFEALQVTVTPDGNIGFEGEVPQPEDYQNHLVHIDLHMRLQKTPQYKTWSPLKQMALEAHITGHKAAVYAQMVQEQTSAPPEAPQMPAMPQAPSGGGGAEAPMPQAPSSGAGEPTEAVIENPEEPTQ